MAEELDPDIHRQSVSRSIQYSDYSSGEDTQPVQPETETEDDDDDSSSSSSFASSPITKQIDENKANTKKRTSTTIQTKLNAMTSKFNEITGVKTREHKKSNSGITREEKKNKLAARWQRLVSANKSDTNLHESQQVNKPKKIHSIHAAVGQHAIKPSWKKRDKGPPQKVVVSLSKLSKTNIKDKKNNDPYAELTPIQIWKKKKEERERNKQKNGMEENKNNPIQTEQNASPIIDFAAELKKQQLEELKENNENKTNEIETGTMTEKNGNIVMDKLQTENESEKNGDFHTVETEDQIETNQIQNENTDMYEQNETEKLRIEQEEQQRIRIEHEKQIEIERVKQQKEEEERIKVENLRKEKEEERIETERKLKESKHAEEERLKGQELRKQKEEEERLNMEAEQKKLEQEQEKQAEMERNEEDELMCIEIENLNKQEEERIERERMEANKLKEAILNERKEMEEDEKRKRAESIENNRLKEIEENEEAKRKLELKEKRLRKQQILNKMRAEKKRKKEELKREEERKRNERAKQMEDTFNDIFDRDKCMELIYNHFELDDMSILKGEYILMYLKEKLNENINGVHDKDKVLKDILMELFEDEQVISEWGYFVRLRD